MNTRLFICLLIAVLTGCFGPKDLSNRNLSNMYGRTEMYFHPEFAIFHSDTSSLLFAKINKQDFLFMRQPDDRFKANFTINCALVESYDNLTVIDSSSRNFEIFRDDSLTHSIYIVPFKVPASITRQDSLPGDKEEQSTKVYLLMITINDLNRNAQEDFFVNVDNGNPHNRQAFFVTNFKDGSPLYRTHLTERDTIKINFKNPNQKNFLVSYYHRAFPLAAPPFSFDIHDAFDYKTDSVFRVSIDTALTFYDEGFYHFQTDTSDHIGLTLFRFPKSFPAVTTPDQMIESVRYLTTKREYEAMQESENKKMAIEKFWLDIGGSAERTRMLIKKYYNRVQEANKYFTSHTEGWRTDRGMVYIIFGKPNNVYKSANAESWIYGQPNNALSLNFFFVRVNNPFTDNDYSLNREPIYEGSWYRAVDVWRQGRVYNDQ